MENLQKENSQSLFQIIDNFNFELENTFNLYCNSLIDDDNLIAFMIDNFKKGKFDLFEFIQKKKEENKELTHILEQLEQKGNEEIINEKKIFRERINSFIEQNILISNVNKEDNNFFSTICSPFKIKYFPEEVFYNNIVNYSYKLNFLLTIKVKSILKLIINEDTKIPENEKKYLLTILPTILLVYNSNQVQNSYSSFFKKQIEFYYEIFSNNNLEYYGSEDFRQKEKSIINTMSHTIIELKKKYDDSEEFNDIYLRFLSIQNFDEILPIIQELIAIINKNSSEKSIFEYFFLNFNNISHKVFFSFFYGFTCFSHFEKFFERAKFIENMSEQEKSIQNLLKDEKFKNFIKIIFKSKCISSYYESINIKYVLNQDSYFNIFYKLITPTKMFHGIEGVTNYNMIVFINNHFRDIIASNKEVKNLVS